MKYGKLLQTFLEDLPPEFRDKFLSYKQLKKQIKQFLESNSFPEDAFEPAPVQDHQELVHVPAVLGSGLLNRENSGAVHDDNLADEYVIWPQATFLDSNKKGSASECRPALVMADSAVMDPHDEKREGNRETFFGVAKRKRAEALDKAGEALGSPHGLEKVETSELAQEEHVREKADRVSEREEAPESVRQTLDVVARKGTNRGQAIGEEEFTVEEKEFIRLLNIELEKFNSFFTEKEEDYVNQLQELKQRLESARVQYSGNMRDSEASEELLKIHTDLVTFHGEVVLMENYSTLNYTGLVKILKKHDKRTGAVLRLPFIRRVLLQPFFSTELLSKLVQDCVSLLSFFPPLPTVEMIDIQRVNGEEQDSNGEVPRDVQEFLLLRGENAQSMYKSSLAALRTLKEIRKRSSPVTTTVQIFREQDTWCSCDEILRPAPAICVSQAL